MSINKTKCSIRRILYFLGLIFAIWGTFITSNTVLAASEANKQIKDFQLLEIDKMKHRVANFEDYRQGLDDLFRIALVIDSDHGGINNTILDLNRKLTKNPNDYEMLVSLGHLYRLINLHKEAVVFYQKAMKLKPGSFDPYFFSAVSLYELRDFTGVLEQLNHAIQIRPNDPSLFLALGRTFWKLNKKEKAGSNYRKALEMDPDNEVIKSHLGAFYLENGRINEALQIFETLPPKKEWERYRMGYLYLVNGKVAKSLEILEQLFREGVRDPIFLYHLALAYYRKGDFDRAKKIFEPLHFMFPNNPDIQFLYAKTYIELDRFEEAITLLKGLITENPDYLDGYTELALALSKVDKVEEGIEVAHEGNRRIKMLKKTMKEKKDQLNHLEELIKKINLQDNS